MILSRFRRKQQQVRTDPRHPRSGRHRRRWVRRVAGGEGARRRARASHARRPPQSPPVPAPALPGGDGRAFAGGHRAADSLGAARPVERGRRPRRGRRDRCRGEGDRPRRGYSGRLPYDYLILAAGAHHAYFGHDEWAPNAPGLKTLEDALDIRRRILTSFEEADREPDPARRKALMTFVVVGGGPTGVEMAGAIAEIARFSLARDFRHIDTRDAQGDPDRGRYPAPRRVSRPALPARTCGTWSGSAWRSVSASR